MRVFRSLPPRADRPIALTIGNFDGVHRGHQAMVSGLLAAARERSLPACVMTFEPHPREFFSPEDAPPRLTTLRDKCEQLGRLGADRVYVCRFDRAFSARPPEVFVREILLDRLGVRWLLVGDDFRFGARRAGDFALLRRMGAESGVTVESMPTVEADGMRVSSTAVREALARGDMAGASRLLGRPFSVEGRVVGGDRIGRDLGFPTANIRMRLNRPPLFGIFAVEVHGAADRPVAGAASLGLRPTVTDAARPVLEVFLLDFSGDLYGRRLRLDFLLKLRDEEKYPSLDALKAQIAADVGRTREFFARRGTASAAA